MRKFKLLALAGIAGLVTSVHGAATLFNGMQAAFFPTDTPVNCLATFNTSLACSSEVQLLVKQTDWVGWNATNLQSLCTTGCRSALVSLQTSASAACSSWTGANLGGTQMNATTMMEYIIYKYSMTCLADGATFCHKQRETWNIPSMITAGKATWPKNTKKIYYDWANDPVNGTLPLSQNGTEILPYSYPPSANFNYTSTDKAAMAYVYAGGPRSQANFGWPEALESDEYPLEIQCSKCFVDRFVLGYSSVYGSSYDDTTAQVWKNMKLNCPSITQALVVNPVLNVTGPGPERTLTWVDEPVCAQRLTNQQPANTTTSCQQFCVKNNIPTAAFIDLNYMRDCTDIGNGTFCAPLSCQLATIDYMYGASTFQFLPEKQPGISVMQFMAWNPFANFNVLGYEETVCIGPPGGAYIPSTTVAPAYPTIFTTTAKPAVATAPGTIPNCGLYYNVTAGDECNLVAIKYALTQSQFINMNPSLDLVCSNLKTGVGYCVAPVNGTLVPTKVTTTSIPSATATTIGGTTYPLPPQPTRAGSTSQCKTWYTVVSSNTCDTIGGKFGVTFAQLRAWNTFIDATCSNLWPDYSLCVSSPLVPAVTTTSTTAKPATTTVPAVASTCINKTTAACSATPAPIQDGAVAKCKKFYFIISGDTCSALATKYGFTVAQFIAWNPAVGSTCNVWLSEWYCIGL